MGKPCIGVTVGDPAGIGPEIARKVLADPALAAVCDIRLYGPSTDAELARFEVGRLSAEAGRAAYDAVLEAVADAQAGTIDAIATAPVNKAAFAAAGLPWKGHTDLLAHLTGAPRVAMMFHAEAAGEEAPAAAPSAGRKVPPYRAPVAGHEVPPYRAAPPAGHKVPPYRAAGHEVPPYGAGLRVVLATVHVPLADVARTLTRDLLEGVIGLAAAELPRFGVPAPRLALAGLNPHAGEGGLIGGEEADVLVPAVAACRARGIDVDGPFPGDTIFLRAMRGEFDAVVACYHDQGLIPIKMAAFGRAVNVTLGLPIVRTSVDHGTAFDIAGRGIADPSSLAEAIRLAVKLCSVRLT